MSRLPQNCVKNPVAGFFCFIFACTLLTLPVQAQPLDLQSWEYDPALKAKKDAYSGEFKSGTISTGPALEEYMDKFYFARWTALEDLGEGHHVSAGLAQEGVRELRQDLEAATGTAREYLLTKSFETLQKMAADPMVHPSARFNAVFAIGQLVQANPAARNAPPTLYAPALPYLMSEYQKEGNPPYIKLAALNGVVRHAGAGIADENLRNETVPQFFFAIIDAGKPGQNVKREEQDMKDWFRQAALDGLANLRFVGAGGKTVTALLALMADTSETLEMRTKAARTLGNLDFQAAKDANIELNYQLLGSALITLMQTVGRAELQTVSQLRDKSRVTQGIGGGGASLAAGSAGLDPVFTALTPEVQSDVIGAVQSIKSNVQNVVYGLRRTRFSGKPTEGVLFMLPEGDAVAKNMNAMMTQGVVPLFKLLDDGPPEAEVRGRAGVSEPAGSGRATGRRTGGAARNTRQNANAAESIEMKVNLQDIQKALEDFGAALDKIVSGA